MCFHPDKNTKIIKKGFGYKFVSPLSNEHRWRGPLQAAPGVGFYPRNKFIQSTYGPGFHFYLHRPNKLSIPWSNTIVRIQFKNARIAIELDEGIAVYLAKYIKVPKNAKYRRFRS